MEADQASIYSPPGVLRHPSLCRVSVLLLEYTDLFGRLTYDVGSFAQQAFKWPPLLMRCCAVRVCSIWSLLSALRQARGFTPVTCLRSRPRHKCGVSLASESLHFTVSSKSCTFTLGSVRVSFPILPLDAYISAFSLGSRPRVQTTWIYRHSGVSPTA